MLRACSGAIGPVLSRILVVPVCYGPLVAVGSSSYIGIGQSSNWLRTDRGTSLNVGASTQGTSRCLGSGAAVGRGTCNRCDSSRPSRRPYLSRTSMRKVLIQKKYRPMCEHVAFLPVGSTGSPSTTIAHSPTSHRTDGASF